MLGKLFRTMAMRIEQQRPLGSGQRRQQYRTRIPRLSPWQIQADSRQKRDLFL
jgi:hypothetical protein